MNKLTEIRDYILEHEKFILSGHISPDGDCIGATFALALALKKMGKEAKVYLESFLPVFHYLGHLDMVTTEIEKLSSDTVSIFLDASDEGRLGEGAFYLKSPLDSINIDHHSSNNLYADYNYVEADASSTCEIIYNFITLLGVDFDRDIAKALFTGLIYDTGTFRHPNTKPSTMMVASHLLQYDIGASDMINHLFYTKSLPATQLLGQALGKIVLYLDNQVALTSISLSEIEKANGQVSDVDGIVSYVAQVEGTECSIFLYEKAPDVIKVSLRSKKIFDVAKFASRFGGGGHIRAAGCTFEGSMDQAKEKVLEALQECRSDFQ